jgi:2-polyprenyl-3-methyl-5-hydroxy-6-metoxy-1,4-benzoquinol methylase
MAPVFWLRAASERSIVRAHLLHLEGSFRAAGWRVHTAPTPPEDLGDGLVVLDDPWAEPFPELATALLEAPVGRRRRPCWRIPRVAGGPGAQGWSPPTGLFTLAAYRRAALRGRPRTVVAPANPWTGLRAAPAAEADMLLQPLLRPSTPQSEPCWRLAPGVRLYRYDDPADHERRELVPFVPAEAELVVDVGCGHGRLGELLRRPGRSVVGIEPDAAMAEVAAGRLDRVLAGPAESELPRLEGAIDCAVFADVLEHTADPAALLREVREHLAPGGVVVVSVPNLAFAPILRDLAAGRYEPTVAGVQARDHLTPFTPRSLVRMAEETGFTVERLEPLPAPLTRRQRWWARLAAWSSGGDPRDLLAPQWVAVLRATG